jgi:excisionase family DNA binding protein
VENQRERLLSIPQFSEALGLTVSGTRRWLLERRVAHVKVGRLVRIPESELVRIVADGFRPARQRGCNGR